MTLWVPESARLTNDVDSQLVALGERHQWLKFFDRELRELDEGLSLVKASDSATEPGLKPGYWHIRRENPGDMASYFPLEGDEGEFVEPSSEHLGMMRRMDLQNPRAFRDFVKRYERLEADRERRRQLEAEERQTEFAERLESHERAHVSMAGKWTNSVKGKKN